MNTQQKTNEEYNKMIEQRNKEMLTLVDAYFESMVNISEEKE
jgi:hypothetical protein